jgi:hypothetical protein
MALSLRLSRSSKRTSGDYHMPSAVDRIDVRGVASTSDHVIQNYRLRVRSHAVGECGSSGPHRPGVASPSEVGSSAAVHAEVPASKLYA